MWCAARETCVAGVTSDVDEGICIVGEHDEPLWHREARESRNHLSDLSVTPSERYNHDHLLCAHYQGKILLDSSEGVTRSAADMK